MKHIDVRLPSREEFSSKKEWEEACWKVVSKSEKLLASLTTPLERRKFVLRAAVLQSLEAGETYRKISEDFQLASQTIGAIKKISDAGYQSYDRSSAKRTPHKTTPSHSKIGKIGRVVRTKYGPVRLP